MGWKKVKTMHNANNAFGPRTANKCTVHWWFKKFCKGDKSLENEEHSGWPLEIGSNQLRGSSKLILWKLHEKLKNSTSTILWSFGTWSKLERWKNSTSRCLMSLEKMKKIITLKCHRLLFYTTTKHHFSIRLWPAMKSGFYMTTRNNQLVARPRRSSKALSKAKLAPKKRSWSLFGGPLLIWSITAFWISVKPLHLRSMLMKSMRCTTNCNAYSQHWSTERTQFFSVTMPNHTINTTKLERIGLQSFASSVIFTWPLDNRLVQSLSRVPSLRSHGLQHTRLPCPSLSPGVYSNSCLLSQWCHPTISSSVALFSCPKSFPASFPASELIASGGQSIGASASASVLPMNI